MTAWYAIRVAPQREMEVELILRRDGVKERLQIDEVYCPIETYSIRVRGKRAPVIRGRPLVQGYIFARCSDPYLVTASMRNRGVKDVLREIGSMRAAVIGESAMHGIKICEWELANKKSRKSQYRASSKKYQPSITVGAMVSIPHLGFNVPNVPGEKITGDKAEVTLPMLGARRTVTVSVEQLELA